MRLIHCLITTIAMLGALNAAARPGLPEQARIDYTERSTGLPAVMDWRAGADQYSLSLRIPAVFLTIEYRSTGVIDDGQGLKPQQFLELRNDQPKRRAVFDWQAGQLRYNDERDSAPLQANAQDLLSLSWQLALKGAPSGDIQLTNGRKIYEYALDSPRSDQINVGGKALRTLVYQPKSKEAEIQIWLARDYGNMPVRIVYRKPGEAGLDLQASVIRRDGRTLWSAINTLKQD